MARSLNTERCRQNIRHAGIRDYVNEWTPCHQKDLTQRGQFVGGCHEIAVHRRRALTRNPRRTEYQSAIRSTLWAHTTSYTSAAILISNERRVAAR
jgi:hypothetical protein